MATINGEPVDTTLYPTVTRAFRYDVVTVPPRYEAELLGAKATRKTVRFRRGRRVACKTWRDFEDLREAAQTYGGEVQFI
jgi:hypothetical protein